MNVYEIVTERIIGQLKEGIIPWRKPWQGGSKSCVSYTNGRPYSMLNQMLLGEPGQYVTFNQVKKLGGNIKKGAKSQMVVFWKMYVPKADADDKDDEERKIPVLRYYNVFNVRDAEGLPVKDFGTDGVDYANDPIAAAEAVVDGYRAIGGPKMVIERSDAAYYTPSTDTIVAPELSQYPDVEEYYSTLFHEMVHSTGAAKRLNRKGITEPHMFGSKEYAREELVAEIGSAMLCNRCGIETKETFDNSTAYIQSWAKRLSEDDKLIVVAAGRAEKAVRYMTGDELIEEAFNTETKTETAKV